MGDRDEVQVARWAAIRERVGACLRELRSGHGPAAVPTSQARLSGDLEDLGYHVTQSMISRYEQGVLDAPLTLERLVGWALCCASLSAPAFRELMELAGFHLPWTPEDLRHFDELLARYRSLPLPDQVVLKRKLLWHVLGLRATALDSPEPPRGAMEGARGNSTAGPAGDGGEDGENQVSPGSQSGGSFRRARSEEQLRR